MAWLVSARDAVALLWRRTGYYALLSSCCMEIVLFIDAACFGLPSEVKLIDIIARV